MRRLSLWLVTMMVLRVASATTFYVDAAHGSDAKSGVSEDAAWAKREKVNAHKFGPGDAVLFHAGQTWTGTLEPKGSGTAAAPIVIGSYGDGAKPVIAGAGAGVALLLNDVSFWTVKGIAVTNHGKTVGIRNGVEIRVAYVPVVQGIHLVDVDISDVNGEVHSKSSGGIGVLGWDKNGKSVRFDDLLIEHCTIRHADGQGMWFHMKGKGDSDDDSDSAGDADDSKADSAPAKAEAAAGANGGRGYPITRLRITRTTIEDTGRNAVFLRDAEGASFDHNVVLHSSARTHGNAVVVAWSKDTVVRENEVAFTGQGQGGGENGGFDADDGAVGTVFEYNWTHDNTGGSVNVVMDPHTMSSPNEGTIVRFNLSENDGVRAYSVGGPVQNTVFANNTIYVGKGRSEKVLGAGRFTPKKVGDPDKIVLVNNLFLIEGNSEYPISATHVVVDSNCYVGRHAGGLKDAHKVAVDGIAALGIASEKLPAKSWAELAVYRPAAGSACAGNGAAIGANGGRDLLGNALGEKVDRGALVVR